ncbi:hypothetical protein OF83DRAFT_790757 [Amylostereum chailletii]|nr:hypothetical protein OF83DRAFT_790757 [Amylostereum chailletii]
MDADTLNFILHFAGQAQAFQYVQVAGMALFAYDSVILFTDEVNLIWKSRWTIPKVLYFLSRYVPFVDLSVNLYQTLAHPQPSPETCHQLFIFVGWSMAVGMALSEVVMILRVYAMWDRSRSVLYGLGTLWLGLVATSLYLIDTATRTFSFIAIPFPGASGCHYTVGRSFRLATSFLCLLVMEIAIVTLMVWAAATRWRSRYVFKSFDMTFKKLYFDGVFFFVCLLALSTLNILLTFLIPDNPALTLIFVVPLRVAHAILSCRLLLNTRRLATKLVVFSGPHPVRRSTIMHASASDPPLPEEPYIDLVELPTVGGHRHPVEDLPKFGRAF